MPTRLTPLIIRIHTKQLLDYEVQFADKIPTACVGPILLWGLTAIIEAVSILKR